MRLKGVTFQFFKEHILTSCHQKTQTEVITSTYHSMVKKKTKTTAHRSAKTGSLSFLTQSQNNVKQYILKAHQFWTNFDAQFALSGV